MQGTPAEASITERLMSTDVLAMDVSVGLAAVAVALVGASFLQAARTEAETRGEASLKRQEAMERIDNLRFGLLLLLLGGSVAVAASIVGLIVESWLLGAAATAAALLVLVVGLVVGVPMLSDPSHGARFRRKG